VLIPMRFAEPIANGEVTVVFRRWKRLQVVAGHTYRTAAGRLFVDAVDEIDPARMTGADAKRAGYKTADDARADLRGDESWPTYRIRVHLYDGPDERAELAEHAQLSADEIADIDKRLTRLDKASSHGPWTRDVLEVIAQRPGVRAPDLAKDFGRETQRFKLDVRKLKNLGLTISLRIGYELSPRGRAYLGAATQVGIWGSD
jgi:hypothetical protein